MIKKLLLGLIAAFALAAIVGVAIVALAMALYAALLPGLGPIAAPAVVFGVAVLALLLVWAAVAMRTERRAPKEEASLLDRLTQIARERPALAAGAALAAGLIALKNPRLVAGLASAFLAGKAADRAEHRRRW